MYTTFFIAMLHIYVVAIFAVSYVVATWSVVAMLYVLNTLQKGTFNNTNQHKQSCLLFFGNKVDLVHLYIYKLYLGQKTKV